MSFNEVMMQSFHDELQKQASALGYGAAAIGGGAVMYGAGKAKKIYGLAKKEQSEQDDEKMLKRMRAMQQRIALRKQYGAAFNEQ